MANNLSKKMGKVFIAAVISGLSGFIVAVLIGAHNLGQMENELKNVTGNTGKLEEAITGEKGLRVKVGKMQESLSGVNKEIHVLTTTVAMLQDNVGGLIPEIAVINSSLNKAIQPSYEAALRERDEKIDELELELKHSKTVRIELKNSLAKIQENQQDILNAAVELEGLLDKHSASLSPDQVTPAMEKSKILHFQLESLLRSIKGTLQQLERMSAK